MSGKFEICSTTFDTDRLPPYLFWQYLVRSDDVKEKGWWSSRWLETLATKPKVEEIELWCQEMKLEDRAVVFCGTAGERLKVDVMPNPGGSHKDATCFFIPQPDEVVYAIEAEIVSTNPKTDMVYWHAYVLRVEPQRDSCVKVTLVLDQRNNLPDGWFREPIQAAIDLALAPRPYVAYAIPKGEK